MNMVKVKSQDGHAQQQEEQGSEEKSAAREECVFAGGGEPYVETCLGDLCEGLTKRDFIMEAVGVLSRGLLDESDQMCSIQVALRPRTYLSRRGAHAVAELGRESQREKCDMQFDGDKCATILRGVCAASVFFTDFMLHTEVRRHVVMWLEEQPANADINELSLERTNLGDEFGDGEQDEVIGGVDVQDSGEINCSFRAASIARQARRGKWCVPRAVRPNCRRLCDCER